MWRLTDLTDLFRTLTPSEPREPREPALADITKGEFLCGRHVVKVRRGTSAEWAELNPVLRDGEIAFDKTVQRFKLGDGVTPWNALPWWASTPVAVG